jgi:hypothetical protein
MQLYANLQCQIEPIEKHTTEYATVTEALLFDRWALSKQSSTSTSSDQSSSSSASIVGQYEIATLYRVQRAVDARRANAASFAANARYMVTTHDTNVLAVRTLMHCNLSGFCFFQTHGTRSSHVAGSDNKR